MHIKRPLGKRLDKKYVVNDLGCHVVPWRCWSVFRSAQRHYEWTQVSGTAQREDETADARPRLHDLHARWRSLSPIKGSH